MNSKIKQMLDFNKKAFDDSFNTVVAVQEHVENLVYVFWENTIFFPEQSRKVIGDCFQTYKNGLNDFKSKCDSRFKILEYYILNATDQIKSSKKEAAEKTTPTKNVDQATKKVVPRKRVVKNKKLTMKKGKQK